MLREFLSWRRRSSSRELIDDEVVAEHHRSASDHAQSLADTDAAWRMLGTLPRKQRAVLVMRYYLDQSDEQIAETLKCSPSTVRSNAARGLATLRATQNPHAEEVKS
jgi:RNA polymerase sigma factor (sigma-70 family)